MGNVVGLFPEGKLTLDGKLGEFKTGIERILKETPSPVIPLALEGMWGSFFSNKHGKPLSGVPRRIFAKIKLTAGKAISAEQANAGFLHKVINKMLALKMSMDR